MIDGLKKEIKDLRKILANSGKFLGEYTKSGLYTRVADLERRLASRPIKKGKKR